MIRARIIAASVEGALCAAAACPFFFLSSQAGLGVALSGAIWVSGAFLLAPLTLALRALSQGHPAPEHKRHGLILRGSGCHACRWMRFWWPLALAPVGLAVALYTGVMGLGALGVAGAALQLALGLSALGDEREPHWAHKTGFRFEPD